MPGQPYVVTKREGVCCLGGDPGTHIAAGGDGVDLPCECTVAEGVGAHE